MNSKYKKYYKLIEKINVLGPWVSCYFDLGNGVIIEDKDEILKKRRFSTRDSIFKILNKYYSKNELRRKTLCDVGCNTGYFLFEVFKEFNVKKAIGIEPRETNLKKSRFIAKYFKLPKNRYQLKKGNVLDKSSIPKSDIVIIPGVMHHLDNHLKALEKIYNITNELCIIETMVLSDKLNSKEISKQLELKDILYQDKKFQNQFGIIGLKLESNINDGSTIHSGIVGIPTTQALILMMKHVGFNTVEVFHSEEQLRKNVFNQKSYREFHSVIVVGIKNNKKINKNFGSLIEHMEEENFEAYIPFNIINNLYNKIINKSSKELTGVSNLIYESELFYKTKKGEKAAIELKKLIGKKKYFFIIKSIKHAPYEKICYEYSKTCYHLNKFDEAAKICQNLIKIMNLDWRVTYYTYFLLAKIYFDLKDFNKSKKHILLSLRANPDYSLSKKLFTDLNKVTIQR